MENQENILDLYYNKHLKQKDIATMVGVSKQYVSKVVKADSRCKKEKQTRKDENTIKRKDYMKEYFKSYDRPKKEDNSSIYHRDKNGNLRLNKGIKVGSDVPKTINMNIPIPTQKYKYRCYSM